MTLLPARYTWTVNTFSLAAPIHGPAAVAAWLLHPSTSVSFIRDSVLIPPWDWDLMVEMLLMLTHSGGSAAAEKPCIAC